MIFRVSLYYYYNFIYSRITKIIKNMCIYNSQLNKNKDNANHLELKTGQIRVRILKTKIRSCVLWVLESKTRNISILRKPP